MRILFHPIDSAVLIFFRFAAAGLFAQELLLGLLRSHELTVGFILSTAIFSAAAVSFNFYYRFFSTVLFFLTSYLFLTGKFSTGHDELYWFMSFWFLILPFSVKRNHFPAWVLFLLLSHVSGIYILSAVNLLRQAPLYYQDISSVLFYVSIIPLLVLRETKLPAFILVVMFHAFHFSSTQNTYPFMIILLSSLFLNPSWPRKIPIVRNFLPWGVELVPGRDGMKLAQF